MSNGEGKAEEEDQKRYLWIACTYIQKDTAKDNIIRVGEVNGEDDGDTVSVILLDPHTLVGAANGHVGDPRQGSVVEGRLHTAHDGSRVEVAFQLSKLRGEGL